MTERKKVMSWLEGLTYDDWRAFHSDSEVQNIARAALEYLKKEPRVEIDGDGIHISPPDLVRCRNCVYEGDEVQEDFIVCGLTGCGHDRDYFCRYGKRRKT